MTLSVRLPDEQGLPHICDLTIKQLKTCMYYTRVQPRALRTAVKAACVRFASLSTGNMAEQSLMHP